MTDRALTPPQYARSRGIHVQKVLTWIATGELKAINLATRRNGRPRWRIRAEDISDFEAGRGAVPPPPRPRRQRRPKFDPNFVEYF